MFIYQHFLIPSFSSDQSKSTSQSLQDGRSSTCSLHSGLDQRPQVLLKVPQGPREPTLQTKGQEERWANWTPSLDLHRQGSYLDISIMHIWLTLGLRQQRFNRHEGGPTASHRWLLQEGAQSHLPFAKVLSEEFLLQMWWRLHSVMHQLRASRKFTQVVELVALAQVRERAADAKPRQLFKDLI